MDSLKEQRFVQDITRLKNSVNNRRVVKKTNKVAERLGRLKERYSSVAHYYNIDLTLDDNGEEVKDVNWAKNDSRDERSTLTGAYVIESSHQDLTAREIWNIYTTLVQVEYSFHCLKTDLGFRPIFTEYSGAIYPMSPVEETAFVIHLILPGRWYLVMQTLSRLLRTAASARP
jgi:hypothetical protein